MPLTGSAQGAVGEVGSSTEGRGEASDATGVKSLYPVRWRFE